MITLRPAPARRLAAAAACWTPAAVSGASERPEYFLSTDIRVCPCRSRPMAVGSPRAGPQAALGGMVKDPIREYGSGSAGIPRT